MLNQRQINMKWRDIKGGIRNLWAGVTEDELEKLQGNIPAVTYLIHQMYGEDQKSIEEKMTTLLESFDNETDLEGRSESSYMRNPTAEDRHY